MAVRRLVAGAIGLVILLVLFFVVRACNDSRSKNALKDYNLQVGGIATQSRQTGEELFKALGSAGDQSPQDLYTQINSLKSTAEKSLEQAQALSVPGDMADAQQSLLISLMLRRDALGKVAADIRSALGDPGDAADRAIKAIAAQNQAFNASDVLYNGRVRPFIQGAFTDKGLAKPEVAASTFMNEISWVSAPFVASKLGQQLSTDNASGDNPTRDSKQPTGPGLHGTGLNATAYGDTTLQPGASNRLVYTAGQAFTVSFTNQGDNDEFTIKVTVKIARTSGGAPLTLTKTVPRATKGEKVTVTLPLNRQPPLDTALNISVTVAAVPGEQKTDNNKSSYPSLFSQG
jgi:hypothetical protein